MSGPLAFAVSALIVLAGAVLLVRVPRGLIVEASGAKPPARLELGLMLALAGLGGALLALLTLLGTGHGDPVLPLCVAAAVMALAAVAYIDLRFLVIPDLCSLALAALALTPPIALPWREALLGAGLCGGMLWAVAFAYKRYAGVDGMGFGDVKLAAALGGLLGMQQGLWTVTMAAIGAAAGGMAVARFLRRPVAETEETGPFLIPYGAALAAAGAGWLIWSRR